MDTTTPKPEIYLTFDDGPYPSTESILEILKENGVPATFFFCSASNGLGKDAQYRAVKKAIEGNHLLGNHGDDHYPASRRDYLAEKNRGDPQKDFRENREDFETLFKNHQDVFPGFRAARLPGDGRFIDDIVRAIVAQEKVPHFGWHMEFAPNKTFAHVNYRDWQGIPGVSSSHARIPHSQCILLLHDSHWRGAKLEGLKALIKKLKELAVIRPLPLTPPSNASRVFLSQYTGPIATT
ncbi:polysaccharide deacetylase family protein [Cystobacter fuscus]|uniref:polysaccharide deacetylase family protein n=1 Tax=Cystobacter fuscus TaxID=43 RepID=UPI002B2FB65E|nr:polysaccharide deacetylase family protein [Cystobacter fuscus]